MKQTRMEEIRAEIQKLQSDARYEHTVGVMYTAAALAMRHGGDWNKAMIAGLLHDCAKGFSGNDKLSLCEKYGLTISEAERKNPGLLHAKLGAHLAREDYEVTDEEILAAIKWHTTGRPQMTLLDKIIYIADYIEPNRVQAPNLDEIRRLAFFDIDECLYTILEASLAYLRTKSEVVDPMTEQTYLYYKEVLNK